MMHRIRDLIGKAKRKIKLMRLDFHFKKELDIVKKQSSVEVNSLIPDMAEQVRDFRFCKY